MSIPKNLVNAKLLVVGKLLAVGKLLVLRKHLVHTNLFSVGKHLVDTRHVNRSDIYDITAGSDNSRKIRLWQIQIVFHKICVVAISVKLYSVIFFIWVSVTK